MHFAIFTDFVCSTLKRGEHGVTENVCGNPTFYVQGDKSFCKWKIEKSDEMRKNRLPKIRLKYIGHVENSMHVQIF